MCAILVTPNFLPDSQHSQARKKGLAVSYTSQRAPRRADGGVGIFSFSVLACITPGTVTTLKAEGLCNVTQNPFREQAVHRARQLWGAVVCTPTMRSRIWIVFGGYAILMFITLTTLTTLSSLSGSVDDGTVNAPLILLVR